MDKDFKIIVNVKERIESNFVEVYSYYNGKKIGVAFLYYNEEEYNRYLLEACKAIAKRIEGIGENNDS